MPKIKIPKKSPSLDMTPMVDLAFLLVTFFMLTTKFRPDEPVMVDMPSSINEEVLPEKSIITISVDKDGRAFYNVDEQKVRKAVIERMGERYNVKFTPQEVKRFSVMASIGVPIKNLKEYLNADEKERKEINAKTQGIPYDSLNNELREWLVTTIRATPNFKIALKGDMQANYPAVKGVFGILQDINKNSFYLVTNLEGAPKEQAK